MYFTRTLRTLLPRSLSQFFFTALPSCFGEQLSLNPGSEAELGCGLTECRSME